MKVKVWGDSWLADHLGSYINSLDDDEVSGAMYAEYHVSAQHDHIFTRDEIDRYGYILNIHFSDTSVMRGCNVMSHAIELGLEETAITFHVIDEGIDTGPIVLKIRVPIDEKETAYTLYRKCSELALEVFTSQWHWLREKPEGIPLKIPGPYYGRDLNREMPITREQERFIRSRTFTGKPRPYVIVDGEEMVIGG